MSDFDKEAEREKLRKQFAEDEQQRENTRRMSELLLKGATMTDTHCDTCGDPIFRWEGEEFCPTCSAQQGATAGQGRTQEPEPEPEDGQAPTADPTPGADLAAGDSTSEVAVEPETPPAEAPEPAADDGSSPEPSAPAAESPGPTAEATPEPATGTAAELSGAQESLVRTLTRFASEAESTGNPAEARERLAAVEAAAEALAAVRRADR